MKTKEMLVIVQEVEERNSKREQEWREQQKAEKPLLRMLLIDVWHNTAKFVDVKADLDDFYRLINCNTIDIARRSIGGKVYEIICDDDGLFQHDRRMSAMDKRHNQQFVGNLLICKYAGNGELAGLTDSDCVHLSRYIRGMRRLNNPAIIWPVLTCVEYC